jgi:hypothetical protein
MVIVAPIIVCVAILTASLFVDLSAFIEKAHVLTKANIIHDLTQRGGFGRLNIWQTLLARFFETPSAWIFGFGPGSVEYYVPSFTAYLNQSKYLYSPHSNFVGSLYCFGVYGFALFAALLYRTYQQIRSARDYARLKRAIGAFYLVTFMLDSHILASQGMFIHLVFLAFLMSESVSDIAVSAAYAGGGRRRRRFRVSFEKPPGL